MIRSRYRAPLSAPVIEAARTAVGEELRRRLSVVREPPPEIEELIARLVALDSMKRRAAECRAVAFLPLQLPLPRATHTRS
jgi:hypothetical protein